MSTAVTVKGQVTLPKAVRDAVGIKPGDRVTVRATPQGQVVIERERREPDQAAIEAAGRRIDAAVAYAREHGFKMDMTTDEFMQLMRGDDD
ncbi:AbrB/MazE/SpoVT family DNA-binding domain-containing protein [Terrarubrum flagellatum]|uniref:AbrB/MazE/SpoVT family DNA-binding domain-containing protein n=1 Tax=Terrirubrum flagellatum TaxID=2895980 RepID=UPI0031454198